MEFPRLMLIINHIDNLIIIIFYLYPFSLKVRLVWDFLLELLDRIQSSHTLPYNYGMCSREKSNVIKFKIYFCGKENIYE